MLPAASPTNAPARVRFVGAPCRAAHVISANGTMAISGIDTRHSSHSSPASIALQCDLGESARLRRASRMMAMNGNQRAASETLRSPPGRMALPRELTATPKTVPAKSSFRARKSSASAVARSVPYAQRGKHQPKRGTGADPYRRGQTSPRSPAVDGLDVGREHVDQFVGLHDPLLLEIERDSAFNPRWTLILTAASDIPHRRAASVTLRPSIFTQRITRCILSGS